jgi:hypothetical protein
MPTKLSQKDTNQAIPVFCSSENLHSNHRAVGRRYAKVHGSISRRVSLLMRKRRRRKTPTPNRVPKVTLYVNDAYDAAPKNLALHVNM